MSNSRKKKAGRKVAGGLVGVGSAAAIVGAGIAALTSSAPPQATPAGPESIQSATLTGDVSTPLNQLFLNNAFPPVQFSSGNPAPKTPFTLPGTTPTTTNNGGSPDEQPFSVLTGVTPTETGLSLSAATSGRLAIGDPSNFAVGIGTAAKIGVDTDGNSTLVIGGPLNIAAPPYGGGTAMLASTFKFNSNLDLTSNPFDSTITGFVNLLNGKNSSNVTGFQNEQFANPGDPTDVFLGPSTSDPLKQPLTEANNALNSFASQAGVSTVNMAQQADNNSAFLFPQGFATSASTTAGVTAGVPGFLNAPAATTSPAGTNGTPGSDLAAMVGIPGFTATPAQVTSTPSGLPASQFTSQASLPAGVPPNGVVPTTPVTDATGTETVTPTTASQPQFTSPDTLPANVPPSGVPGFTAGGASTGGDDK